MTRNQYLAALRKLELTTAGQHTASVLGLSIRQIQRLANGENDIPGPVARLLECYLKYGLPEPGSR